jgi:pyruvate dehydrogenase E2 component (dihydrolipoamide acetyltransferase)
MTVELKMPALSPTMEKGTLAKWLVAQGDMVKPGDLLAEIETDKATMEIGSADEGMVAQLVVPEGTDGVAVGSVIALFSQVGATAPPPALEEAVLATVGPVEAAPDPAPTSTPVGEPASPQVRRRSSAADPIKVSPVAQRIADIKGIDLTAIAGSGPDGRIVRADLGLRSPRAFVEPAVAPVAAGIAPPPAGLLVETVKLSSMRKTIARRLTQSKSSVPHFYLSARCHLDPLLALRAELNAALAPRGIKLSVNDMLIKALALALLEVPAANVQFGGDVLHRFARADISMAVAIDGGLVTPVIHDAGTLSLSAIAQASKALAEMARNGKLRPEDYDGGTASLSNLGMFGIDEMFPVINPPQALILGTAAGIEQPWKVRGQLTLATVMATTASFDHRAIDGATAAQFMNALRKLIESPMLLCG